MEALAFFVLAPLTAGIIQFFLSRSRLDVYKRQPLHHSTHLFQKLEYNGAHQVRTGPLGPYT